MINLPNKRLSLAALFAAAGILGRSSPLGDAASARSALLPGTAVQPKAGQPNEMGRVPILMYHSVGEKLKGTVASISAKRGLNISSATFRAQLEAMYRAGWYPVNMRDLLSPDLDVPEGKTPFVITFDDARRSQFRYIKDGSIDPDCALGVLLAMHRKYGQEWPNRASFYVVPESRLNPPPFGQKALVDKKLKFLVDEGFEVANHSTSHHSMHNMSARQLQQEMETCFQYVRARVPGATMDTMALPYGAAPRRHDLWNVLLDGRSIDPASAYQNRCILMAWGGASYSPWDKRFDNKQVMRIGAEPGYIEGWIASLKKQKGSMLRYISDGDPKTLTIPASQSGHLDRNRLKNVRLVVIDDLPPKPVKKRLKAEPVAVDGKNNR